MCFIMYIIVTLNFTLTLTPTAARGRPRPVGDAGAHGGGGASGGCVGSVTALSGPETGKRKRVARKADGKLTLLVNLGVSWHEKLTLLFTHFSLPILAYPFQGH